ncbi:MAG: RluA family pseudouridine synthase [Planctomycetes bacterium]|nr:RluA family pseudouridine synthase [Planctomycetota bacterium]
MTTDEPDTGSPGDENAPDPATAIDASDDLLRPGGKVDAQALYDLYEQAAGDDEQQVAVRFVLSRDLDKRLDRYLVDRIPFLSRTSLQRLIREHVVTVNGRVPKASTRLRRGDVVVAVLPPPPSTEIPAEEIPLEIIHEDDDLIILNKHDDIIVHPARGNRSGTIINGLAWHFRHRSGGALSSVGAEHTRPGVVHRLDRHTTGVMVAAKSDVAHWRLGRQFEQRKTEKRYLAIVHGRVEPDADVIDMPIGKHPVVKFKYAVRWDPTGKDSVTVYRVRERYEHCTLVELELKTGRTHQIRVHLSHLGYPIVGDDVYGGRHLTVRDIVGPAGTTDRSPREPVITRQALHAALLGFTHPVTEQPVEFQAPLPQDMRDLIELLRLGGEAEPVNIAGTRVDVEEALGNA